jgi:hypothetical protein
MGADHQGVGRAGGLSRRQATKLKRLRKHFFRHPEVRAKRASKDVRPGPSLFEGRISASETDT